MSTSQKKTLFISTVNDDLHITGDTFPVKSAFEAIGGKVSKISGSWTWKILNASKDNPFCGYEAVMNIAKGMGFAAVSVDNTHERYISSQNLIDFVHLSANEELWLQEVDRSNAMVAETKTENAKLVIECNRLRLLLSKHGISYVEKTL